MPQAGRHPDGRRPMIASALDAHALGGANGMQRCPKCRHIQPIANAECKRCGVIFAKLQPRLGAAAPGLVAMAESEPEESLRLGELLFDLPAEETRLFAIGRALLLLGMAIWGIRFLLAPIQSNLAGQSFLHLINLPFHEAGHILFAPFGRFLGVLGGSLMQLLVPLVVAGAFLWRRNPFGGAVGVWWLGESCLDLAPYIGDARAGQILLLGGVTGSEVEDYHDWEVILRQLGWLRHDIALARLTHVLGAILILLALLWAGVILVRQLRRPA
jgi:hypothetical protein